MTRPTSLKLLCFVLLELVFSSCAPQQEFGNEYEENDRADDLSQSCQSPLFQRIVWEANRGGGSIAAVNAETHRNYVASTVSSDGAISSSIHKLILSATQEINIETWRWQKNSEMAQKLIQSLEALSKKQANNKATSPITVRFLINILPIWSLNIINDLERSIENSTIDSRYLQIHIAPHQVGLVGANHAKNIIVDNSRAIITGANFSHEHDQGALSDASYWVEGSVAQSLNITFSYMWRRSRTWLCGTETIDEPWFDDPEEIEEPLRDECWLDNTAIQFLPVQHTNKEKCVPIMISTSRFNNNPFRRRYDNPQARTFLAAVNYATDTVRIMTPNLNEYPMMKALVEASKRGVKVQIILSRYMISAGESVPSRGGNNLMTLEKLHGLMTDSSPEQIEMICRNFSIRWYTRNGIEAPPAKHSSHRKYMSVDSQIAIVGSGNLDVQSWQNSRETNLLIDSAKITQQFDAQVFLPAFRNSVPTNSNCLAAESEFPLEIP